MKAILLLLLSLSIIILSIGTITPSVFAQQISSLDLTTPTGTDLYGGDKKGTLNLNVQEGTVIVNANQKN